MRNIIFVVLAGILFNSLGCSQLCLKNSESGQTNAPLKESRVFKPEKIAQGGRLLVVPFSAGAGVTANEDLDRVSLLIVKGIADFLEDKGSAFKILHAQDAQRADFVIKGRIVDLQNRTGFKNPWSRTTKHVALSVEGSLLGVEDDDILAKFAQTKQFEGKDVRSEVLAYEIGVEIGRFLASYERP